MVFNFSIVYTNSKPDEMVQLGLALSKWRIQSSEQTLDMTERSLDSGSVLPDPLVFLLSGFVQIALVIGGVATLEARVVAFSLFGDQHLFGKE